MILNIPVNEVIDIIKANTQKSISLRVVNENTINVGYDVNVKIPLIGNVSKTISIDLILDKVVDTDIYLHYSTGIAAGDSVVKTLLSHILTAIDSKIVDRNDDGCFTVHLKEIKQLEVALEKIKINSISFGQDAILVEFTPKM